MKLLFRFSKIKQVILRSMLLRHGPAVKINVRKLILYFGFRYRKRLFAMLVNWYSPDQIYLDCGKTDIRKKGHLWAHNGDCQELWIRII